MKKLSTLLSIAILFSLITQAQNGKIIGSVKDASMKGIHSATVSLLKLKDSSVANLLPQVKTVSMNSWASLMENIFCQQAMSATLRSQVRHLKFLLLILQ